ncbi:MAG: flagellar motor switch protein FliN [Bryobacteraceae bacterium]|jgi:flagellar motor switch protein FliN/FliY
MTEIQESVASFLSALTSGLEELLSQAGPEPAKVSWAPRPTATFRPDLLWWSCGVSVDPACTFLVGAPDETWSEMGRDSGASSSGGDPEGNCFAAIAQVIQQVAESRFGAEVLCSDMGPAELPPDAWTSAEMTVSLGNRSCPPMDIVLSPELVTALGGKAEPEPVQPPAVSSHPMNPVEMLMHVEVPVSVSLGRTQLRVKDLLSLTQGSIVELDQELSDEVDVRVNNCVIARGEVVAVDGNYGVRILKIVSAGSAPHIGVFSEPAIQRPGRN